MVRPWGLIQFLSSEYGYKVFLAVSIEEQYLSLLCVPAAFVKNQFARAGGM
jgi:hypothetical protein